VESTALHVLRIVQEESMKENTGAVHVQVPVDVASFLLNEKRAEIQKLEARLKVNIILVPNPHLETPHYKVQRLKHDELNQMEHVPTSYELVEQPEEPKARGEAEEETRRERQEAVVKAITPAQPAPVVPEHRPQPERERALARPTAAETVATQSGFLGRLFGWLKTEKVETAPASAAPEAPRAPQAPERARDQDRRRPREDRRPPRGERHEQRREQRQEQRRDQRRPEPQRQEQRGEQRRHEPRPPQQEGQPREDQRQGQGRRGRRDRHRERRPEQGPREHRPQHASESIREEQLREARMRAETAHEEHAAPAAPHADIPLPPPVETRPAPQVEMQPAPQPAPAPAEVRPPEPRLDPKEFLAPAGLTMIETDPSKAAPAAPEPEAAPVGRPRRERPQAEPE